MKKLTCILIMTCLTMTMAACSPSAGERGTNENQLESSQNHSGKAAQKETMTEDATNPVELTPEELAEKYTTEKLVELTTVKRIVDTQGTFSVTEQFISEETPYAINVFGKDGAGNYETSSRSDSFNGSRELTYFCSDADDPYMYDYDGTETEKVYVSQAQSDYVWTSYWDFSTESTKVDSVRQDNDQIIINATNQSSYGTDLEYVITIEASTERILKCIERDMVSYEFAYGSSIVVDRTAKEKYKSGSVSTPDKAFDPKQDPLVFNTVDIKGNEVTEEVFQGATLVILNFFNSTDQPSVAGMGELEKLYQAHKDQGLVIIGIYSETDDEDMVKGALESYKISFPVVKSSDNLRFYEQTFTPAAFLLDGKGKLLTDEVFAGVRPLSLWENAIEEYMD